MKIEQAKFIFKKSKALELVALINSINQNGAGESIRALKAIEKSSGLKRGSWGFYARRFRALLENELIPFSIFAKGGNTKLPFVSFSTIPGATCPGAGECLDFCYSFKAWRYPAAFFRQLQNMYLMNSKNGRGIIAQEFKKLKLKKGQSFLTFRLYVDGDFKDINHLTFWMNLLFIRPEVKAYGYSKSWEVFLEYVSMKLKFPSNYLMNLSSGSIYGDNVRNKVNQLECTRGEFIVVDIDKKYAAPIGKRTREYNKAVRDAAGDRVFVCPGLCGSCTPSGHACGLDKFKDVKIAIASH